MRELLLATGLEFKIRFPYSFAEGMDTSWTIIIHTCVKQLILLLNSLIITLQSNLVILVTTLHGNKIVILLRHVPPGCHFKFIFSIII